MGMIWLVTNCCTTSENLKKPTSKLQLCEYLNSHFSMGNKTGTVTYIYGTLIPHKLVCLLVHAHTNLFNITVALLEPPVLISGSRNIIHNTHEEVQMTCTFSASLVPYLSICAWTKGSEVIDPSDKYHFNQTLIYYNEVVCTLTVLNVTNVDGGKYYCYVYYNESFWLKYNFLQCSNISSQSGEIRLQIIDSTGKFCSHLHLIT